MKSYKKPVLNVECFTPNEFVAACHDWNTVYKFTCDAGGGARGDVYTDAGQNLTSGKRDYYYACGTTHEASTQDQFISGYYIKNGGNDKTGYWDWFQWKEYEKIPVIIWRGPDGDNVHCTTNLDQDSWEEAKS